MGGGGGVFVLAVVSYIVLLEIQGFSCSFCLSFWSNVLMEQMSESVNAYHIFSHSGYG